MDLGVYCTALELQFYIDLSSSKEVVDDRLYRATSFVSREIDAYCQRHFYPLLKIDYYDHSAAMLEEGQIYLAYDCLDLLNFHTDNGSRRIPNEDLILRQGISSNFHPFDRVEWKTDTINFPSFLSTPQNANEISYISGYHDDISNMWLHVGSLAADFLDTETVLPFTSPETPNPIDYHPILQEQQLLRIGEDWPYELAFVIAVDYDSGEVRLIRGVNGTHKFAYTAGANFYVFQPILDIKYVALLFATYVLRRRDQIDGTQGDLRGLLGGTITDRSISLEVREKLNFYIKTKTI